MAYSEELAQRLRHLLEGKTGLAEKKLFGGVGFLLHGNMACGTLNDELVVRVGRTNTNQPWHCRIRKSLILLADR